MLTKGTCFNISLNGKRPLWGYFLLVTDQGEEFIIKRNSKIPFDRYRKVYQTSYSFKDQIFFKESTSKCFFFDWCSIRFIISKDI